MLHIVHRNKDGYKTDITLGTSRHKPDYQNLTFSKIVAGKLATINKTIPEDMPLSKFMTMVKNVTSFDDKTFLLIGEDYIIQEVS